MTISKPIPEWAKLIREWRHIRHHTGLTLPLLCVATGQQPEALVEEIRDDGGRVSYCHAMMAPYIYYEYSFGNNSYWPPLKGARGVSRIVKQFAAFNTGVIDFPHDPLPSWWDPISSTWAHLAIYAKDILLSGKESRGHQYSMNDSSSYKRLTSDEVRFISKTLGHPPYKVVGLTEEGEIEYAAYWKRDKSSRAVLIP